MIEFLKTLISLITLGIFGTAFYIYRQSQNSGRSWLSYKPQMKAIGWMLVAVFAFSLITEKKGRSTQGSAAEYAGASDAISSCKQANITASDSDQRQLMANIIGRNDGSEVTETDRIIRVEWEGTSSVTDATCPSRTVGLCTIENGTVSVVNPIRQSGYRSC